MKPTIDAILNGKRAELRDMPWAEYLDFPGLNASCIKRGQQSLLHLKHAWDEPSKSTDAMQFGSLLHCLLFEPREAGKRYRAWTGRRAGNDYKAFIEYAAATGAEVVKADGQYSLASALEAAQGFLKNARVQSLTKAGKAEQAVLAVEDGLQCKGRLDWVSTSEHSLVDLKTTNDIRAELFGKTFFNFGYDISLGLYQRWLQAATNDRWPVEIVVLESKPPYDVAVMPIPDAVLERGVDKAMVVIRRVRKAIAPDEWPGCYNGADMPLWVPPWEMQDAETNDNVRFDDE